MLLFILISFQIVSFIKILTNKKCHYNFTNLVGDKYKTYKSIEKELKMMCDMCDCNKHKRKVWGEIF